MHKKRYYSALSADENYIIANLMQGKDLTAIASDLEITARTIHCLLKKLLVRYQCDTINALLKHFRVIFTVIPIE